VPWSRKQQSFIAHSDAFLNVADGAVRSGKTHANLVAFARYCIEGPAGDLGVFGRTERTVKRNVVYPLIQGLPKGAVRYVQGSGELFVFGRRCWIFGANDARAEEKVQGSTLAGGYGNEVPLYPEGFLDMALSRSMTVKGARWFLDGNPEGPFHWFYLNYLTAGHPKTYLKRWRFRLDDNPILPPGNVEMLKALYGPGTLFYRRNIDGEWVMAEGVIYAMLDLTPGAAHVVTEVPDRFERVVVGVDYGTSNDTVFLAAGKAGRIWTVFSEERYSANGKPRADNEHSQAYRDWVARLVVAPSSVEVDPSAASFKVQLRQDGVRGVRDADHDVKDGIRTVMTALTNGTLKIHESCEGLLSEMSTYAWDPKAQERGEDKPIKANDHGPDALRYLLMRVLSRPALTVVRRPAGL
jgi:PBSX family phage terminase large subunit